MKYLHADYTGTQSSQGRQFSEDVQGSWILSPMNLAWSLASCLPRLTSAATVSCCLTLRLSVCRMRSRGKLQTCSLTNSAEGLAVESRYHNECDNVTYYARVIHVCVPSVCLARSELVVASLCLDSLPPGSQMMGWPFHLGQECSVTHSMSWKLIPSINTSHRSALC